MEWSSGWLLERMVEFEGDPEKWKDQPIGLADADPDIDPMWDSPAMPPPGWERLPMHIPEGVNDGE